MTFKPGIPSQQEADFNNPEEHFVWCLRNMPTFAGIGAVTHPGFLRAWSKHLWECGNAHRDYLVSLANEDGFIHIDQLPKQTIELQGAFRGPSHIYNNAARWVPVGTATPPPVVLPDTREMTIQESDVMLRQFERDGRLPGPLPRRDVAQELNREEPGDG
ncbi:Protein of uncharacterised function (DUF2744) [Mycobacteroides abscessus subsp. massiliense]|nr:Protein of uncharacterised function (DUF2744) [Mycobacteroides abscessus subsp. massiliense]